MDVQKLELDKILSLTAAYASLDAGKELVLSLRPAERLAEADAMLKMTEEATRLIYFYGAGGVQYFPPLTDELERAQKGAALSCAELLHVAEVLRSVRLCYHSVQKLASEDVPRMKELTFRLQFDERLEQEITDKITGENEIADNASERLYRLRREIRALNEKIRARLAAYFTGDEKKFLQDAPVTLRGDRYVLPVKAEYKRSVKGFVHDRSATGATLFIEPEEVLEMNNELRTLTLDEKEEEERILSELSRAAGSLKEAIEEDIKILAQVDSYYARAQLSYRLGCVKPQLNDNGIVRIVKGRHPLLDRATAVPVSVQTGEKYQFLLVSGANTGGKTVTLKMCGLFCLMAACGMYVPAQEAYLAVFDGVYCDIGDSQSIEENLSTFSSHIVNLTDILARADKNSLVLIDEPGGGTDPEEGQALARAILAFLLRKGCKGIVTTHYTALKEFAYETDGVENGCMEFDFESLRPLYRLKLGAPGSSNALAICSRLGVPDSVIEEARGFLSEASRSFERTLRAAEEERIAAQEAQRRAEAIKSEWEERLSLLERDEEDFKRERERFLFSAKAEAKRVVNERAARAEELLDEIEQVFRKETYTEADLIRARTLKNRILGEQVEEETEKVRNLSVNAATLSAGDTVFVAAVGAEGVVIRRDKTTAEVQCGLLRVKSKITDLYQVVATKNKKANKTDRVKVVKKLNSPPVPKRECNVIGLSVQEATEEVENFLDAALVSGQAEVRIVHGMGTGKLRAAVHDLLKKHRRVAEFRIGQYGEGESGVTIVKLK